MWPLPELEGAQAAAATSGPHGVLLQGNLGAACTAQLNVQRLRHRNETKPADSGCLQQN